MPSDYKRLYVDGNEITLDPSSLPDASGGMRGVVYQGESVAKSVYIDERADKKINEVISSLRESAVIADNKYVIIYNLNPPSGMEYSEINSPVYDQNVYLRGESATIRFEGSDGYPYCDGYNFIGWSENSSASVPEYDPRSSYTIDVYQDITLYAVWERLTHTITYHLGDLGMGEVPGEQIAPEGEPVEVSFTRTPSVNDGSGREFVGWATSDLQTYATYKEGDYSAISVYADTDLYPVFAYKFVYNLGDYATGAVPSFEYGQYGEEIGIQFATHPEYTSGGLTFCGWCEFDGMTGYENATYGINGSGRVIIYSRMDVYPIFSMQYRLIYSLGNMATGSVPSINYYFEGEYINVEFTPSPSHLNEPNTYVFKGWSTIDEDSTPEYSPSGTTQIQIYNDVVLYPVFGTQSGTDYITIDNTQYQDEQVEVYHNDGTEYVDDVSVFPQDSDRFYFSTGNQYYIAVRNSSFNGDVTFTGTYQGTSYNNQSLTLTSGEDYNANLVKFVSAPDGSSLWSLQTGDNGTITVIPSGNSGH